MSLSDEAKGPDAPWGTIYMRGAEHTLGGVERGRSTAWTEQDEAAYLERVREKAKQMAEGLLAEARAEAERIRDQARQQGYEEGLASANEELDQFRAGMTESVAAVLNAIEGQCSHIFNQWREDIVAVARLAVERITAVELSEKRRDVLEGLLTEAVGVLEKRRQLVVRVNPEDEPMLSDIIGLTKERFADVQSWRVKADAAISPGGMVVESESSLAEGRVESRIAAVDQVLSRLTLPEHPDTSPESHES